MKLLRCRDLICRVFNKNIILIVFIISGSLLGFAQRIHRVHPPQNTPQYQEEAERVHLDVIAEKLGLDATQKLKLKKLRDKQKDKNEKYNKELIKEEQKFASAKDKIEIQRQSAKDAYSRKLKNLLGSDLYEKYLKCQAEFEDTGEDVSRIYFEPLENYPSSAEKNNKEDKEEVDESNGSLGPIIKAKEPPLMYE